MRHTSLTRLVLCLPPVVPAIWVACFPFPDLPTGNVKFQYYENLHSELFLITSYYLLAVMIACSIIDVVRGAKLSPRHFVYGFSSGLDGQPQLAGTDRLADWVFRIGRAILGVVGATLFFFGASILCAGFLEMEHYSDASGLVIGSVLIVVAVLLWEFSDWLGKERPGADVVVTM